MGVVKNIIGLSKTQLENLFKNEKIETEDGTLSFNDESIYLTPDEEAVSNPNLLINGDFRINQRGQASYNALNKYTSDRWKIGGGSGVIFTPKDNGGANIKVTSTWSFVSYKMEEQDYIALRGKTVTLSCYVSNIVSNVSSLYFQITGGGSSDAYKNTIISDIGLHSLTFTFPTDADKCEIRIAYVTNATSPNVDIDFDYVKLEIGSVATPFVPRPYAEELALCQRYGFGTNVSSFGVSNTNGDMVYVSVPTPTTIRNYYTLTYTGTPKLRGNGQDITASNVSCTGKENNFIQLAVSATVIKWQLYQLGGIKIFIDCEIY